MADSPRGEAMWQTIPVVQDGTVTVSCSIAPAASSWHPWFVPILLWQSAKQAVVAVGIALSLSLKLACVLHTSGMQASSFHLAGAPPPEVSFTSNFCCNRRAGDAKFSGQTSRLSCHALGASAQNGYLPAEHGRPGLMSSNSEQRVSDVVLKQVALVNRRTQDNQASSLDITRSGAISTGPLGLLSEAYMRCGELCEEYAKTFYLGTMLMTPERRKAIWAIYVWCRRTDELVDGTNAPHITPSALDRWQERVEDVFEGKPYDMFDAALADTVFRFPIDIQPFRDMIDGMRMDLLKARYENFDELYLYCYYVAGTVGLMTVPVMGIDPNSKETTESVFNAALALGIANQLTNILRDVGEDARRGRIYLPRDELDQYRISESDIFSGQVTNKWRAFMKDQIKRARMFFDISEKGVGELDKDSRWPVWASLTLYRQILDSIEANDYNNFTKRAYVGKWKKLFSLPAAYVRALAPPTSAPFKGSKSLSFKL